MWLREILQAIFEYPWTFAYLVLSLIVLLALVGSALSQIRK